jgi:hypothetical protein
MNCKELNSELCYGCISKQDCIRECFQNNISSYDNFNEVLQYYLYLQKIKVSETYGFWFIKALELINSEWHQRLIKLIILK